MLDKLLRKKKLLAKAERDGKGPFKNRVEEERVNYDKSKAELLKELEEVNE